MNAKNYHVVRRTANSWNPKTGEHELLEIATETNDLHEAAIDLDCQRIMAGTDASQWQIECWDTDGLPIRNNPGDLTDVDGEYLLAELIADMGIESSDVADRLVDLYGYTEAEATRACE